MGARGPQRDHDRESVMARMYRSGNTLAQVGEVFGVTRERVRQILRRAGVATEEGGSRARGIASRLRRAQATAERRNARYLNWLGCDYATAIKINGGKSCHRSGTLASAFHNQKHSATHRGIPWELTLPEWVQIWTDSGHLHERGRGKGYCMARRGDVGPYSVANVYITTIGQNAADYQAELKVRGVLCADGYVRLPEKADKADGKPRHAGGRGASGSARGWTYVARLKRNPYQVVLGRKYIGNFATAEEARAAYLAAKAGQGITNNNNDGNH